ncbi:hypothetical protein EI555_009181 [Monodon monoceros]|uniref:Uncharacterized protein n=1 Tax=Monodon monoceros TaxID=40151 RepID=A0A4U1EG50_MONMO|nr:hypothetical protein EI555_009181 [Monodon monoceros]
MGVASPTFFYLSPVLSEPQTTHLTFCSQSSPPPRQPERNRCRHLRSGSFGGGAPRHGAGPRVEPPRPAKRRV